MFKDIELSREEMSSYKMISEERNERHAIDLTVNVLSASSWPTYPTVPVIIPPQIKSEIDKFEKHYKAKHSGRKLDWKYSLAHCQVKAKFPKGNKELVVSSFQAIVLLLFNGLAPDEHIDYEYLKEATGLRKNFTTTRSMTRLIAYSAVGIESYSTVTCLRQTTTVNKTSERTRCQCY